MIARFRRYIRKKGLELNVAKSNILIFRKAGERRRKSLLSNNNEIVTVKNLCYLGYELKKNNGNELHRRKLMGKAMVVLEGAWTIGEIIYGRPGQEMQNLQRTGEKCTIIWSRYMGLGRRGSGESAIQVN